MYVNQIHIHFLFKILPPDLIRPISQSYIQLDLWSSWVTHPAFGPPFGMLIKAWQLIIMRRHFEMLYQSHVMVWHKCFVTT